MNEIIESGGQNIKNLIYEIRGKQVMLDSDLAMLYGCDGPRVINQAVSRHPERFPEDFCFQLTREEYEKYLRSQTVILEPGRGKYSKYLPYAFTEQGISMLSSVLRTKIAAEVSIRIMRTFVVMRHYISSNFLEQKYFKDLLLEDHNRINLLESSFESFKEKRKDQEIYFNGQISEITSKTL